MTHEPDPQLDLYIKAALGKKAQNIVVLKVDELTSIADAFIICSAKSHRQVTAIAEFIQVELKKAGIRPMSVEGKKEGHWVLLDYGSVVMHVFFEPVRDFYDLEGLWVDADRIITPTLEAYMQKTDPAWTDDDAEAEARDGD